MNKEKCLFEVSWEVCNKVGGIHTVLRTKAKQVLKNYPDNYIMIGPWLANNSFFLEATSPFIEKIAKLLKEKGFACRFGFWDIGYGSAPEQPLVILVSYKDRYRIDSLLYGLWSEFGVDSLASNFDYYEPILFSTAAAEVIQTLSENVYGVEAEITAHFHEWLCGAGLLHLKKNANYIATIFTTHATVLGRALSGANKLIYNLSASFDASTEAKSLGVFSKHSLEKASAHEASCFTTVSNITADEASFILGKYPDKILPNGLDIDRIQHERQVDNRAEVRKKLLAVAGKVTGKALPENTIMWLTSGRYEFHNKGYDVFLLALDELEKTLPEDAPPIVVFFLVAAARRSKEESLLDSNATYLPEYGISTFKLVSGNDDQIVRSCNELNFKDQKRKIRIVYSDAYLDEGKDGVFDVIYEHILATVDLSVFLSFYEPWGYTPLESIAYGTPTITTDLSGFGSWVLSIKEDCLCAATVLPRKNKTQTEVVTSLLAHLKEAIKRTPEQLEELRAKSGLIAKLTDWKIFYAEYLDAYQAAHEFNRIYYARYDKEELAKSLTIIHDPEVNAPRFRSLQNECALPEPLKGLRDMAYNFWWSWHESVKVLFQSIDSVLWEKVKHNPVLFLNGVSRAALQKKMTDANFMREYNSKLQFFSEYVNEKNIPPFCDKELINEEHPLAYFSMEYGLDECLQIYSGGLGVLAGDYLKTMSDLNIPMVAVGLFYKHGYFQQRINAQGEQLALADTTNPNQIPIHQVNDIAGKPILIGVELLGRTVFARVWLVKTGRISLYLLDTDIDANTESDREITDRLYAGSREHRLVQEIILGLGGVRLIEEKLNIKPSLYHLNEGHSAFLLFERIKNYYRQGFNLEEASELVRASSIFTTHTSVPAGNEVFSTDLVKKYFYKAQEMLGISFDKMIEYARDPSQKLPIFSMTALALKLTVGSNGVSRLHGVVAREIWRSLWSGLLVNEAPIDYVTNGIHLSTWIGSQMKVLYDEYLGFDWKIMQTESAIWQKMAVVPEKRVWEAHQSQKEKLLDSVREHILKKYPLRNEGKLLTNQALNNLGTDVLLIGIARRFATYKRNSLILRDAERLARILTNEQRPVVLLVAGKAHPLDGVGKDLIKEFIETMRSSIFKGRIIFLEEYNMELAKSLVQGVDVWLNTPVLGHEACGTSGMKVGLNGGINFSIRDGWWDEVCDAQNGWEIDSFTALSDMEKRNDMESMYLLDTLEYSIAPLYYENRKAGFSVEWVNKMKASISSVSYGFNSQRMAKDYFAKLYVPVARHYNMLAKNDFYNLREVVIWKREIADRFNTVKIKTIVVNGVKDGKIVAEGAVKIKMLLFSGKLKAHELKVEFVLLKLEESEREFEHPQPVIIPFKLIDKRDSGILTYVADYVIEDTGFYDYGIRIMPVNELLLYQQDAGVVYWG